MALPRHIEARRRREPHDYIAFIGLHPDHHGHGVGSALLRPILEMCDQSHLPVCLETTCERNVSLYRRLGFELLD